MAIDSVAETLDQEIEEAIAEQSRMRPVPMDASAWSLRGNGASNKDNGERIIALQSVVMDGEGASGEPGPRRRDWSSALDLVQEASEAIRIRDERIAEIERESMQFALQTREELKLYQAQLQAAQRQIQQTEVRAEKAEARAADAETWLARLDEAIKNGFGPVLGNSGSDPL